MCVKLPPGNLNPASYPLHLTSIYTCRVTTAPRVRGVMRKFLGTLEVRSNGTPSYHIHSKLHHEFNE